MSAVVEFYYDYASVYSYLADSQLDKLGADKIVYRPILLGAVFKATGNSTPMAVEAKRDYLDKDAARWARRYGVPLRFNPVFPLNTVNALRLALVAQGRDEFATVHAALYRAAWADGHDIGRPDVLEAILRSAGLPASVYLEAVADQAIKDKLRENTEEAVLRGVFGAPSFVVDDILYFGNDRMDFVAEALAGNA